MADRAFDWNDTIENDSSFTLLPEGDYPFTVVSFERGEHAGSDGIPPCKKAVLTLEIDGGALGTTEIKENLFLHSRMEWKLCQFFTAIGQRKRGEQLRMDWSRVPGARGMARLVVNEYDEKKNGQKTGNKRQNNRVDTYLEPTQSAGGGFVPGAF
jgi:hypothetical protein